MPKHIGNLSNLETLSYFIVEEQNGSDLKELEKLNHLHGTIHIKELGKIIDPTNVATRILKDKKYLEEIEMTFDGGREDVDGSIVESDVSVLEALQPNSNLKMLMIREYRGSSFPNWLRGCHLPNLVSLELKYWLCSHLPPFGQLPFLKELSISVCDGIKIIGEEFYGNSSTNVPFKSLEVLKFERMTNWEEWLCVEAFPLLQELSIKDCPKLKWTVPPHLPSLRKLDISGCNKLAVSTPKAENIEWLVLRGCDRVLINELSTCLKRFVLKKNRYIKFSQEENLINNAIPEEFVLSGFVECPSLDLHCYHSLSTLRISGLSSSSLPFSLHLFTKLHSLCLFDCVELKSFPTEGLPSDLRDILIQNCPKLVVGNINLHH